MTESHTSIIPLFIDVGVQSIPPLGPKYFDLFTEDNKVVPIVGTKRG